MGDTPWAELLDAADLAHRQALGSWSSEIAEYDQALAALRWGLSIVGADIDLDDPVAVRALAAGAMAAELFQAAEGVATVAARRLVEIEAAR